MLVIASMLFLFAIGLCIGAIRKSARALGVDLNDALVWLGLAEIPAPQTSRRRR